MFPEKKLSRIRNLLFVLFAVSVVAFFMVGNYLLMGLMGLISMGSIYTAALLDSKVDDMRQESKERSARYIARLRLLGGPPSYHEARVVPEGVIEIEVD